MMTLGIQELLQVYVEDLSEKIDPHNENHTSSDFVKPSLGAVPSAIWEEEHKAGYDQVVKSTVLPDYLEALGSKDPELVRLFSKLLVYQYEVKSRKQRYHELLAALVSLTEGNFIGLNLKGHQIADVKITRELFEQSSTILVMNNLYISTRISYLERLFRHFQPSEQTRALFLKLTEKFKRVTENGKDREKSIKEWNEKQNESQIHQEQNLESQKDVH